MKEELKELTDEQKEKIVDEVNAEALEGESTEEGNTSLFTMDEIDPSTAELTPQQQYEKAVTANSTSLATLDGLFSQKKISQKNMRKLVFATLKLPEEGATLEFGGTEEQKQLCEFAYAHMQIASNTRAFVLGVSAMRQQRKAIKVAEEQAKLEESKEDTSIKEKDDE